MEYELLSKLTRESGALTHAMNCLYGSFHFPNFNHPGTRNTLIRLDQLDVPKNLKGKSAVDSKTIKNKN